MSNLFFMSNPNSFIVQLVRIVKKVAPLTELTDKYVSANDSAYLQEVEWKHKEYITPEYLHLKESNNYKLIG